MKNIIDKEKLMEAVNILSKTGDVCITEILIFGQDDVDGNYLEVRLPGRDEPITTGFDGDAYDEIFASIVREINKNLDKISQDVLDNKLEINQKGDAE